jgi:hypothetical protein
MASAYDSTAEACTAEVGYGEEVVPVTECAWQQKVRAAGWVDFHAVLDVVELDDGHVRVLWEVDRGWPVPDTVFLRSECVIVSRF